jgi:transcriptional regulator with XRE-family HTH domain
MVRRTKIQPEDDDQTSTKLFTAFGKKVREARRRSGFTQVQLAKAAGLAPSYAHELETTGANITLKTLAKVATCLKVSMKDLVPDNEFEAVSVSGIVEICVTLRQVADALEAHRHRASELAADVGQFTKLRAHLEQLAAPTQDP